MVVGAEKHPGLASNGDAAQRALGVIVGHGKSSVVEIAPKRGFLPDGVAEGGRDEASRVLHARVLLGDPGKEVTEERSRHELSPRMALRGGKRRPLLLKLEELVHALELKIAERWSLGDLEEALRTQLVGTYMKANNSRHGVLVVCSSGPPLHRWKDGRGRPSLDFPRVIDRLQNAARNLLAGSPEIAELRVVAIDFH